MTSPPTTDSTLSHRTDKPIVNANQSAGDAIQGTTEDTAQGATKGTSTGTARAPASALNDIGLHEKITAIDTEQSGSYYAIDKLEAHIRNVPHLAISIFIMHGQQLLLQQRALSKYHSGGLWANTVCSHPRWQESVADCAKRRLEEELGWSVPLREFGQIDYAARVGDLFENEHVHCFFGHHDKQHNLEHFNPLEVSAVEWVTIAELLQQIDQRPEAFTEWFKIYMSNHRDMISEVLHKRV